MGLVPPHFPNGLWGQRSQQGPWGGWSCTQLSVPILCTLTSQGHPSGWILSYPSAHPELPSVCLSASLWTPPAPNKILVFTGRAGSQLRSRSPGALPSPGGTWLCPPLCWYKGSQAGEGRGPRPSRCLSRPGSQHGEWWEGQGWRHSLAKLGTRHLD